jgi:hypothetical protein
MSDMMATGVKELSVRWIAGHVMIGAWLGDNSFGG